MASLKPLVDRCEFDEMELWVMSYVDEADRWRRKTLGDGKAGAAQDASALADGNGGSESETANSEVSARSKWEGGHMFCLACKCLEELMHGCVWGLLANRFKYVGTCRCAVFPKMRFVRMTLAVWFGFDLP